MNPTSRDDLAIQLEILPLVMSWKHLDGVVEVLSLDANQNGWDVLLAGQGINLYKSIDETREWSVITKFDACDVIAPDSLKAWASENLQSLKPGGILILGGTLPEHGAFTRDQAHASPETVAQIIHDVGFARARVISPDLAPNDRSLYSALYGASRKFAVVAQKHAFGKAFDLFSPVFLQMSSLSASKRFKRAEEELHARIHSSEARLNNRITRLDTKFHAKTCALQETLSGHINQAQATLRDQAEKIAQLHTELEALRVELKRATRRRGLRKLAYEIKKKLKLKSEVSSSSGTTPQTNSSEKATSLQDTQPVDRIGRRNDQITQPPIDPVPLSAHEIALRDRLFDEQET